VRQAKLQTALSEVLVLLKPVERRRLLATVQAPFRNAGTFPVDACVPVAPQGVQETFRPRDVFRCGCTHVTAALLECLVSELELAIRFPARTAPDSNPPGEVPKFCS